MAKTSSTTETAAPVEETPAPVEETPAPVEGQQPSAEKAGAELTPTPEPVVETAPAVTEAPAPVVESGSVEFTPEPTGVPGDYEDEDGDGVPDVAETGEVIETWPEEFRPEGEYVISQQGLDLAEFYGNQTTDPNPAAQPSVTALEDFLRSHGVGGTNRKPEGYYGPKTRALVNAAYAKYLPNLPQSARNGVVSGPLAAALKAAGASIGS